MGTGKGDRDRASTTTPITFGADAPSVGLHKLIDDREPQSKACLPARSGCGNLPESVKDMGQLV